MTSAAVVSAAVALMDFGSSTYMLRASTSLTVGAERQRYATAWFLQRQLIMMAVAPFAGLLWLLIPHPATFAAISLFVSLSTSMFGQACLQSCGLFRPSAVIFVGEKVIWVVGILLGGNVGVRPELAFGCSTLLGSAVTVIAVLLLVGSTGYGGCLRENVSWNPWAGSLHYGLSSLASASMSFDVPLVLAGGGAAASGVFSAVNKWVQPFSLVASSFGRASIHDFASSEPAVRARARRRTKAAVLLIASVAALLALGSPWIVGGLLGSEYRRSAGVFSVLMLAVPGMFANQIVALALQLRGMQKFVSHAIWTTTVVQLSLVYFLSVMGGATGAAFAFTTSQYPLLMALCWRWTQAYKE